MICPTFDLPGTDGKRHKTTDFADAKVLVLMVTCNHCPHVVAYEERMVALSKKYASSVRFCAINANDAKRYPEDGMDAMIVRAKERGFDFPYLRDDSQETVRALGARFTPEIFVYNADRELEYHGRIDDNERDPARVKSHDLANAIDALLAEREPPVKETQAIGCSVKWK